MDTDINATSAVNNPMIHQESTTQRIIPRPDVDNRSFDAVLGGVIATVILVLLCLLVVLLRYMYRHKGTYHTHEAKGTESAETADAALRNDPTLQDAVDESRKEYFI